MNGVLEQLNYWTNEPETKEHVIHLIMSLQKFSLIIYNYICNYNWLLPFKF